MIFRFGDVSTDAESTARKLISVTSELDSTGAQVLCNVQANIINHAVTFSFYSQLKTCIQCLCFSNHQVKLLRTELEDQEKSLKASVAAQV